MPTSQVANCVQFKTGVGKKGPWTLYKVTTTDGQEPTGFTFVNPGDTIEIEQVTNGQYTNLNYTKAADGAAPAPAAVAAAPVAQQPATPAGGGDARAIKLLVLIANQMAIDSNQIADILEGRA